MVCCEELTTENYVEFQPRLDGAWLSSPYCGNCIQTSFIGEQWQRYLDQLAKADCAAALRRLITTAPPLNVRDQGLPCKGNGYDDEVQLFWYASNNSTGSAKLKGSLEGEERKKFWDEKKAFLTATEVSEELAKKLKKDGETNGTTNVIVVSSSTTTTTTTTTNTTNGNSH